MTDTIARRFHYDTHGALAAHPVAFATEYTLAKHLNALRWRTPFQ